MPYSIDYYSEKVQEAIAALPKTLVARYIKKTNRTPRTELAVAQRRMLEVLHVKP